MHNIAIACKPLATVSKMYSETLVVVVVVVVVVVY